MCQSRKLASNSTSHPTLADALRRLVTTVQTDVTVLTWCTRKNVTGKKGGKEDLEESARKEGRKRGKGGREEGRE